MSNREKLMQWSDICNEVINTLLDLIVARENLGGIISPVLKASFPSQSTDYTVLWQLQKHLNILPEDVLLDIGCAKGRVISWWLFKGVKNKIIGVEGNVELAEKTAQRFRKNKNVSILGVNIFEQFPEEASIIYLYNPFEPFFIDDLKEFIYLKSPDNVRILYYNCPDVSYFLDDSRWNTKIVSVNVDWLGINNDSLAIVTKK